MSSIIYQSLSTLASYFASTITLNGNPVPVYVAYRDQDKNAVFPSISLVQTGTKYTSFNASEVDTTTSSALFRVGELLTDVEIRVNAKFASHREELEDQVIRSFMRNHLSLGCLTLPIPPFAIDNFTSTVQLYGSYDLLGQATWHDEQVFTQPHYSYIEIKAQNGIYVAQNYPDINEIDLAITEDLSSNTPQEIFAIT